MDFIFQGFQTPLPLWSFVLIFIGTTILAWWSYREIDGISKLSRYSLITLRSLVFFILLLILANPFIKSNTTYFERPNILMMLDNSASTAVEKPNYQGQKSYRRILNTLSLQDSSNINYSIYAVGPETNSVSLDSLTFDAQQTNLSNAVQVINEKQSQASAAVVISDGIYTQGRNPIFTTENINIPVFTIGLGDTVEQNDLMVRSVTTNSTGYLNTKQPVTVTISNRGMSQQSIPVQLLDGNTVIASQTVNSGESGTSREVVFQISLDEEGLQQYSIRIPPVKGEWTTDNNSKRFTIDVKDARQNILSVAFEVHPDVRYFRSLLLTDENTNLIKRTWLGGNRFIEGNFDISADSIDLAIIHGFPGNGLPSSIIDRMKAISENIPLIIHATPLFNAQQFEGNIISLPVTVDGNWNFEPVMLQKAVDNASHPILELPAVNFDQLPELSAPIRNISNKQFGTVLLSSIYRGNSTNKPILTVQQLGNRKLALFSAYNWFKLEQQDNSQIRNFGRELILNTVSWAATAPDNQLLDIKPVKTTFSGSDNVILNAFLQNERGEPEADASIDITVKTENGQEQYYSMSHEESGNYKLDIGSLPEGIYSYQATATKENRELDIQKGEFAVASSNAEFLDTIQNTGLLKTIASQTGGMFFSFDNVDGFWDNLRAKGLLDQKEKVNSTYFYPHQYVGWFILVVLLLSTEWILRKYLSLT